MSSAHQSPTQSGVSTAAPRPVFAHDPALACVSIYIALAAILFVLILRNDQGHFTYTLDDPYIHLALAERLARGLYGLNLGETVSPASSILWPFLLIPGAGTPWHQYLPLVLNLIFGTLTAWLIGVVVRGVSWIDAGPWRRLRVWGFGLLLVLAANLPGLTFTGMEHVLQCLTAVVCARALVLAYQGQRIPPWAIAVVVLSPVVRYEDFILVLALACALWSQRRRVSASLTFAASLILPALFSVFLVRHDLAPLPNSLLAKGAAFGAHASVAANLLATMQANAALYITQPQRWSVTLLLLLLLGLLWRVRLETRTRLIVAGATVAFLLQMLAGSYNWFHRYEVYAKIFAILLLLVIASARRPRIPAWLVAALLVFVSLPYVGALHSTPMASENIYQEQFQLHRFTQLYGGNVAVNDIGWVSYNLPPSTYMLDLYGLASVEALEQRNKDAAWMDAVTRRHQVGLVMIYPSWLPNIPADWTPVAHLHMNLPLITAASPDIYFFETPFGTPADRQRLAAILPGFAATLPPGVEFTLHPAPPSHPPAS